MFVLLVFCNILGSLMAMDAANCSPGQTEVVKMVKFNCVKAGQMDPISCMDPEGNEVTIGQSTRNDHFEFMCERDNSTVRILATKCLNMEGAMLQPGESYKAEDGQRYQCERGEDGGLRLERPSVSRLSACQYNGSSYASGRSVQVESGASFICNNNGQRFQWQYQKDGRCVAPDGTNLTYNQVHPIGNITFKCSAHGITIRLSVDKCNVNGQSFFGVEKVGDRWYDCSDAGLKEITNPRCGGTHQLKESWVEGNLEKRCDYRNGQTVIVDSACINNGQKLMPEQVDVTNANTSVGIMCKREKNHALTWRVAADWEVQAWQTRQQGRSGMIDPFMGFSDNSVTNSVTSAPSAARIVIVESSSNVTTSTTPSTTSGGVQTTTTSASASSNGTSPEAAAAPSAVTTSTTAAVNATTSRVSSAINQTASQLTTPTLLPLVVTTSTGSIVTTQASNLSSQTSGGSSSATPLSQTTTTSSSSSSGFTASPTTTNVSGTSTSAASSTSSSGSIASASTNLSNPTPTRTKTPVPLTTILSSASTSALSSNSSTALPTTLSGVRTQSSNPPISTSSGSPSTTTLASTTSSGATSAATSAEETQGTTENPPDQKLMNKCEDANHDVVFVLDQSGRFGSRYWDTARSLMLNMTRKIGTRNTRYALVTFSEESNVKTRFNYLDQDRSEFDIQLAIDKTPHGTAAKAALQRASDILRESQVDRHKTVVYIADEQSTDGDPKAVADVLRDDGAMVFALGVGSHDYRSRELREIANPKSVGFLKNYENMNNHVVSEVLSNRVCGADRSKTKPLTGK